MGIIIYYFAPWACEVFFGDSWRVAGEYIRILTPYYMLRFIGSALSPGLIISKKQKQELLIQILLLVTSFLSFGLVNFFGGDVSIFLFYITITKSFVYILLIFLLWMK